MGVEWWETGKTGVCVDLVNDFSSFQSVHTKIISEIIAKGVK